jgi:glyoxylase-like metal-dependent hydrolase (beta-lactamase superfamily II)
MRELIEVAPGVLVATAELYTTTSTVIAGPDLTCLVVDPAITVADVRGLAGELTARGLRPAAGWSTHPHWDHVLWCIELGDVPRYATPRGAELAQRERGDFIEAISAETPGHDLDLVGRLTPLADSAIPWDGPAAQVVAHDAHEVGHGAVYLPDSGTLLAGDMLSDLEMPLIYASDGDPIGRYRAGLDLLAALDVQVVVPGHGHVGDGAEFRRRMDADRRYLDALERGAPSAGKDERITSEWLRAEHNRQFSVLHG